MASSSSESPIIGLLPPPEGVTPNFNHPSETKAWCVILAAALGPGVALPVLVLRLYTSRAIGRKWHTDDMLIVIGFIFALANSITSGVQTRNGAGLHGWDVPLATFKEFMKVGSISGALTYNLATLFIKVSLLTLFIRFSPGRLFNVAAYSLMFITAGYSIANAFSFAYSCHPVGWDPSVPGSTCIDLTKAFITAAALNVGTDICILLLPVWIFWQVRMGPWQKIGLGGVMMTGGFVCGVSALRLAAIFETDGEADITWNYATNLAWCLAEMYTGIICACLPALRPFFKHYYPHWAIFKDDFDLEVDSAQQKRDSDDCGSCGDASPQEKIIIAG